MTESKKRDEMNPYQAPNTKISMDKEQDLGGTDGYKMNGMWFAGLVINVFVSLFAAIGYGFAMGAIVMVFCALCILGTILMLSGAAKIGKPLFILGSIAFVPIGLVGIFGMRKADEAVTAKEFWTVNG